MDINTILFKDLATEFTDYILSTCSKKEKDFVDSNNVSSSLLYGSLPTDKETVYKMLKDKYDCELNIDCNSYKYNIFYITIPYTNGYLSDKNYDKGNIILFFNISLSSNPKTPIKINFKQAEVEPLTRAYDWVDDDDVDNLKIKLSKDENTLDCIYITSKKDNIEKLLKNLITVYDERHIINFIQPWLKSIYFGKRGQNIFKALGLTPSYNCGLTNKEISDFIINNGYFIK